MDESCKRKVAEKRELSQLSSSIKREEDSKKRTKREAPKETPKEAPTRKEPAKPRKPVKLRRELPTAKLPTVELPTPLARANPRPKRRSRQQGNP